MTKKRALEIIEIVLHDKPIKGITVEELFQAFQIASDCIKELILMDDDKK